MRRSAPGIWRSDRCQRRVDDAGCLTADRHRARGEFWLHVQGQMKIFYSTLHSEGQELTCGSSLIMCPAKVPIQQCDELSTDFIPRFCVRRAMPRRPLQSTGAQLRTRCSVAARFRPYITE